MIPICSTFERRKMVIYTINTLPRVYTLSHHSSMTLVYAKWQKPSKLVKCPELTFHMSGPLNGATIDESIDESIQTQVTWQERIEDSIPHDQLLTKKIPQYKKLRKLCNTILYQVVHTPHDTTHACLQYAQHRHTTRCTHACTHVCTHTHSHNTHTHFQDNAG